MSLTVSELERLAKTRPAFVAGDVVELKHPIGLNRDTLAAFRSPVRVTRVYTSVGDWLVDVAAAPGMFSSRFEKVCSFDAAAMEQLIGALLT
jgi:hypothetical protein